MQTQIHPLPDPSRPVPIWRILGWGGAAALLIAPLIAMQFTSEVHWDETDFLFAAVIFGIVGGLIELTVRLTSNWLSRLGAFFAILAGFMLIWSNLAVGMIGNEDNPINLFFSAVLGIAILGACLSRLHSSILPVAMLAAGATQAFIGLFAGIWGTDFRGGVFAIALSVSWWIASALFAVANNMRSQTLMANKISSART
jgi:hypothetical protein